MNLLQVDESFNQTKKFKEFITLKSLDLQVEKGHFVAIIGEVGSGKSSVISAIIGDMINVDNETFGIYNENEISSQTKDVINLINSSIKNQSRNYARNPPIRINGSVSLVEQVPWIQSMTLRDNILFGQELDEDRYNQVVEIC